MNDLGSKFDHLLKDDDVLCAGTIEVKTISTPGHIPACTSYLIGEMVFVGDVIFMPDSGTGRCDFPKGSAKDLYHSIQKKVYPLPDDTIVFTGHDYQPNGRDLLFESRIGDQKKENVFLPLETTEKEFVENRAKRDKTLGAPKLLLPSIQVNMNAGVLPVPEENGASYLKIPLTITNV